MILPGGNHHLSLGNNIFVNGQGSTGRIANNAFYENGWQIQDPNAFASTIELRDGGSIDMYGTTVQGTDSWRHMFGFSATANKAYFPNGNVGIGTTNPDSKLTVKGTIHSEEVKVDLSVPGPDYVFEEDYDLRSLEETQKYISENKHLPEIPSAAEMEQNGVELGEMNMLLLKKIEELTLYQIELLEIVQNLQVEMKQLKSSK